jgi:phytoene desaturase
MPEADWESESRKARDKVLDRLSRHGVEIEPTRIVAEEVLTPVDWRDRFGLYDGSAFGAAHSLSQIGPFRARNYSRAVEGLYYVGASTTPGTGMPMVVLGGKLTAERILSHAP